MVSTFFFHTIIMAAGAIMTPTGIFAQGFEGYYQHPTLYEETIVFVAEGGLAQRLTTHPGE